jgi:hypothetical protein
MLDSSSQRLENNKASVLKDTLTSALGCLLLCLYFMVVSTLIGAVKQ